MAAPSVVRDVVFSGSRSAFGFECRIVPGSAIADALFGRDANGLPRIPGSNRELTGEVSLINEVVGDARFEDSRNTVFGGDFADAIRVESTDQDPFAKKLRAAGRNRLTRREVARRERPERHQHHQHLVHA